MKESYGEVLASHSGLEPYADDGSLAADLVDRLSRIVPVFVFGDLDDKLIMNMRHHPKALSEQSPERYLRSIGC
jgi:hypothetical protein